MDRINRNVMGSTQCRIGSQSPPPILCSYIDLPIYNYFVSSSAERVLAGCPARHKLDDIMAAISLD
jgi:hypothetical protein